MAKPDTRVPAPNARDYRATLRSLRPILLGATAFSAIVNILMLTGSIYMLQVYDRVLSSGSVPTLLGLFSIVVVLFGFLGFYDLLRRRLLSRAALRLDETLGDRAFQKDLASGSILRDLDTVRGAIASPAAVALFDLPFVPLFLGLLFLLHPWLGWATLAGAAIAALLAFAGRVMTRQSIERASGAEAAARSLEIGTRNAGETIAALGLGPRLTTRWRALRNTHLAEIQSGGDPTETLSAISRAFRLLLQSAILTLGAYLVLRGEMTAGAIIASSVLSGRALAPLDQIAGQASVLARVRDAHQRLLTVFDIAEPVSALTLPCPTGRLDVSNITQLVPAAGPVASGASISAAERPRILSDISFSLEPGDIVGIVGNSGSGKSTLARLLVGAMAPDGGEVRLDGATLDQWSEEDRSGFLGYLPQRIEMLPGTVRDNIARFDPDAKDNVVIDAAICAGVHEMILRLPQGYSTQIAKAGLSGGQMQRLALARAIYSDPALLVLDEPNSNLDTVGEAALAKVVTNLSARGTTVVVITHRLEALDAVDKLIVLESGRLVAFGPVDNVYPELFKITDARKAKVSPAIRTSRANTAASPTPVSSKPFAIPSDALPQTAEIASMHRLRHNMNRGSA